MSSEIVTNQLFYTYTTTITSKIFYTPPTPVESEESVNSRIAYYEEMIRELKSQLESTGEVLTKEKLKRFLDLREEE